MRKNASLARIDPNRIVMGGFSAGAFTTLHAAYNSDLASEGESGNPGYPSNVQGVVAMAGMLKFGGYCESLATEPRKC
jgi:predicted esterase